MSLTDPIVTPREVTTSAGVVGVVEAGAPGAAALVLLHGWPQTCACWLSLIEFARAEHHVVAIDLPGVGSSSGARTDGTKAAMAQVVRETVAALGLHEVTLVGHDIGAMVAYAYLRRFPDLARAVLLDAVIPGVDPWVSVLANPRLWHFGLHAVPVLPETLVRGRERAYFDFFYDALLTDPSAIDPAARAAHVHGYSSDHALSAGFDWYRAFPADAADNAADHRPVATPVLYLRGLEGMRRATLPMDAYVTGLRAAGLDRLDHALVPGAIHYLPDEAPEATWEAIRAFIAGNPAGHVSDDAGGSPRG